MSRTKLLILSLLSGVLLFLGWPPLGWPVILFFAFVPLLWVEEAFSSRKIKSKPALLFGLSYLTFLIWNVSTTWWIWNASPGGAAMAILANSFLMSIVFWTFHIAKKRLLAVTATGSSTTIWLFPIFWLAFEHFHHRWDLTWPWLTLGNAFADNHTWIQWYEYTGVPGGSLWVLIVNGLFFEWLRSSAENRKKGFAIAATILLPIGISLFMYHTEQSRNAEQVTPELKHYSGRVNVVVVQPNIDPYSEKFYGMNFEEQLDKMLGLAKQKVDSTTDYLVFPETALTENMWEDELQQASSVQILKDFLRDYPKLKIITGASTYYMYQGNEKLSATARKHGNSNNYFDAYNTALQIDNSGKIQVYHKSKLVPGVERMPYPTIFGFLENLAIDLGGTAGSLGTQDERTVFIPRPFSHPNGNENRKMSNGEIGIAPVICYESIYGEYVCDYINNGASLIFIITNDGWWGNSAGYEQHLLYGRLRAIETRKWIARSANTGISCFINERGDFSQLTEWWKPAVISESISSNAEKTFYIKYGDLIGRVGLYLSALILVFVFLKALQNKRTRTSLSPAPDVKQ